LIRGKLYDNSHRQLIKKGIHLKQEKVYPVSITGLLNRLMFSLERRKEYDSQKI